MSNLRFYSAENLFPGATVKLSDNAATHATRVLRLNTGDVIKLFNGDGFDYTCELITIKKNEVLAKVKASVAVTKESPLNITLLQGISAGDRMEFGIQKAVELGVNKIVPLKTERSVVKLDIDKAKKRVEHWQNVVIAACEQSGRARIPQVFLPESLSAWLQSSLDADSKGGDSISVQNTRILLNPIGAKKLSEIAKPKGEIVLMIGAEGGLSDQEIALATSHGFQSVVLGARILRTETAPLAAIAAMQTIWGDF
jgi:16S rRNA (uracil1498-N3)-methyltransferase